MKIVYSLLFAIFLLGTASLNQVSGSSFLEGDKNSFKKSKNTQTNETSYVLSSTEREYRFDAQGVALLPNSGSSELTLTFDAPTLQAKNLNLDDNARSLEYTDFSGSKLLLYAKNDGSLAYNMNIQSCNTALEIQVSPQECDKTMASL